MPLPVPPGGGLGTPVTSSDGYLTCTPDVSFASVRVTVNFRGVTGGIPDRVTVTRTVAGVSTAVRGLDWYTSPGAVTAGLDHCCPLGVAASYQAVAANSITGMTWTSAAVTLLTPAPSARKGWIKSTSRPDLSLALSVLSWPDWSRPVPMATFTPLGAKYPTVSQGTRQAGTGQVTFGSLGPGEHDALLALVDVGGELLLQSEAVHGAMRPDVYVYAGELQETAPIQQLPWRRWTLPVVEVAEPPTAGVAVPLPGHTFADSGLRWSSYSTRTGAYLDRMTT